MKYLAQTAVDLAGIIEKIRVIEDKDIIYFDSEDKILKILTDSFSIIKDTDIMGLFGEVWSGTSFPDRVTQAESLLNKKFKPLLDWKKDIDDINVLRSVLKNDFLQFYERGRYIGNVMSSAGLNEMLLIYDRIGLRLLSLKRDYKRLTDKIREKAEEEEAENPQHSNYKKLSLNPDKIPQFIEDLKTYYNRGYFVAAAQDVKIREEDVLLSFQKFLDTDLLSVEESRTEITSDTNFEIENFLLHSDKNQLARKIRETFNTEKGKSISLLLYALESNNPPLITTGNRQLKPIYRALKALFNRDIGTYQSVNYKYIPESDNLDLNSICLKLNHILSELKKA